MAGRVKWWEREPEPTTVWRQLFTEDGLDYYVNTETNETTWDKPEELMTADELKDSGDWLWAPHPTEAFVPARRIGGSGNKVEVERKDGTRVTVPEADLKKLNRASLKRVVADLTLLDDMVPPLILHNLKERFSRREIYTNVGTILISVNPYQSLDLYTDEVVKRHVTKPMGKEMPPHTFNIAHDAFYGLTGFNELQSIVISGESGAGKTEAAKQCLQYLAAASKSRSGVEKKILMANPILEAFGNAKTLRNDNSSRFGKYIEIYFNDMGRICGSSTRNYLLEKIRVVNPSKGERNFHIFYQLVKGADPALHKQLKLETDAKAYQYLASCTDVENIDDKAEFAEVLQAFKDLEISTAERDRLFDVVAGVVALGNVTFREADHDQAEVDPASAKWIDAAAVNLGVDPSTLKTAIVTREIRVRGHDATRAVLNLTQASDARHALAKFVYGRMFDWLVQRINKSMTGRGSGGKDQYIGILDIFGFEILAHNSFEQLCINYTNEMLQQHFNNNTFKIEEQVYTSEGIDFKHVDFIDNEPMIELITNAKNGILPMLDEELVIPNGSDQGFLDKLADHQARNPVYKRSRKQFHMFQIQHYAGLVDYDGVGFLDKNRDTLQMDLVELLQGSTNELIVELYPAHEEVSSKERKSSLSKQFQQQLRDLMRQLYRTEPHYIRCVKPNHDKAPMKFVSQLCYEQLTYSGVFEAVAIRKQGYPFRLTHGEFASRYAKVCKRDVAGSSDRETCEHIFKAMKLDTANIRIGKTRVLYRAMEYRKLELEWEIITKNERILEALDKLMKLDHEGMDEEEKEDYIIRLADAVRQADLFRIKTPAADKGRALLEHFVEERMDAKTKRQLEEARDQKSLPKLQAALDVCEREGYITKLVRECRQLCEDIEDCEAALHYAAAEMNEDHMQKALDMCDAIQYNAASVVKMRKQLKDIKKAKKGVEKALQPPYKVEWLKKAVEFCEKVEFTSFDGYVLCNAVRQSVITARRMLEEGQQKKGQQLLENALQFCYDTKNFNGHKYKCTLEGECKALLERVTWVNKETARAMRECEEHQVRGVVAEAKAIGMTNKDLDHLRKLVKGDYGKFLAEQFKKAKKCKHHDRAVRVGVKLKDRELEGKMGALEPSTYPGLKDPMAWSSESWTWGSTSKRAENMLNWQAAHLHSPLTQAASAVADPNARKELATKVITAFDTVQKFMGERNTLKMPFRLAELLVNGVLNDPLRDEVYLHIMKQCTLNGEDAANQNRPGWRSHAERGIELMALVALVFPPSPQLENYVEAFVRRPEHAQAEARFGLKGLLRRRAYHGALAATGVPPAESFAQARMDGKRYCDGATESVFSQHLRLDAFKEPKPKRSRGASEAKEDGAGDGNDGGKKKKDKKKKGKRKSTESAASSVDGGDGAAAAAAPSPGGSQWQAAVDPSSGRTYYYDPVSKETRWDAPGDSAA